MSKVVEFKVGNQTIPFTFSMEQFAAQYSQQNQKQFDPNVLAEDVLYHAQEKHTLDLKVPFANQAAYVEGPLVNKVKKGFFSKKPVQEPSKYFLLFKDEKFKEIPVPQNDLAQKAGGLWPFVYEPNFDSLKAAGKLYSTGKRIILDAYYMDMTNNSVFPTTQFWGNIDLRSFAGKFNLPHLTLKKFIEYNAKGIAKYEPFPTIGVENEVEYRVWREGLNLLGGLVKVNIPGSEKAEHMRIYINLKGPDGSKAMQNKHSIYGISEELDQEIQQMQPVKLEDILAMWQYASNNGFSQSTTGDSYTATKKPISLTI